MVFSLHQLGFANRRPRLISYELTEEQAKKKVIIYKQLLAYPQDLRFERRLVTGSEKWILFYNPNNRNQWIKSGKSYDLLLSKFDLRKRLCCTFGGILRVSVLEIDY